LTITENTKIIIGKMNANKLLSIILIILLVIFVALSLVYIFLGGTWGDEGNYFNFSLLICKGKIPYIDFWQYQAPVLPYIYSLPQCIFGPNMYLARFTSFIFALLALWLVYLISKKLISQLAGIIAVALIVFNPFTVRFLNTVTLPALTNFLMLLSVYFLLDSHRRFYKRVLSVSIMVIAVAVRLTVFPALGLLIIYLLIIERKNKFHLLAIIITALITIVLIWGPFLLLGKDQALYGNLGWYLTAKEHFLEHDYRAANLTNMIKNKINIALDIIRNYLLISTILATFIIYRFILRRKKVFYKSNGLFYFLGWVTLFLMLVHIFLPLTTFTTYALYDIPFLAILAGGAFVKIFSELEDLKARQFLTIIFLVLLIFTAVIQDITMIPPIFAKDIPDIAYINKVSAYLKAITNKDDEILTFHQHFVAQANRFVSGGLEMAVYAYVPSWSEEKCRRFHLYNTKMILDITTAYIYLPK
jgi:4-amino-4-deoxy-L-arabinose transferase-like glycosyltransferase